MPPIGPMLAGLLATLLISSGVPCERANAQAEYPAKPIRLVVGFSAGGPADIIARVAGSKLGVRGNR